MWCMYRMKLMLCCSDGTGMARLPRRWGSLRPAPTLPASLVLVSYIPLLGGRLAKPGDCFPCWDGGEEHFPRAPARHLQRHRVYFASIGEEPGCSLVAVVRVGEKPTDIGGVCPSSLLDRAGLKKV